MAGCPLMVVTVVAPSLSEGVGEEVVGSLSKQIMSTNLTSPLMLMEVRLRKKSGRLKGSFYKIHTV